MKPEGTGVISVPYRKSGGRTVRIHTICMNPESRTGRVFENHFKMSRYITRISRKQWMMTTARLLHLQSLLGLDKAYRELSKGDVECDFKIENRQGRKRAESAFSSNRKGPRSDPLT